MRNEQLKSNMTHCLIKFYFGIRNNQVVKLDKDMQESDMHCFCSLVKKNLDPTLRVEDS
jgi:hypothetical protein